MLCSYCSKDWDNFCCFLITFSEGSGLSHVAVLGNNGLLVATCKLLAIQLKITGCFYKMLDVKPDT